MIIFLSAEFDIIYLISDVTARFLAGVLCALIINSLVFVFKFHTQIDKSSELDIIYLLSKLKIKQQIIFS